MSREGVISKGNSFFCLKQRFTRNVIEGANKKMMGASKNVEGAIKNMQGASIFCFLSLDSEN